MGYSWALAGELRLGKKVEAYRRAPIDPSRFEWPESWGEPNSSDETMTPDDVLAVLAHADARKIAWSSTGLSLAAVFSNDSELWLDLRSHLLGLALVAADVGGEGEIAVTGWLDGGPFDVYRATAKKGASDLAVLTARGAAPVAKRINAAVDPLVSAVVARAQPKSPPIPASVRAIHERVCAALRACDPKLVVKAVASAKFFAERGGKFDLIERLFPKAPALLGAIDHGWPDANVMATHGLPALALRVLGSLDSDAARAIAKDVLALKSDRASRPFVQPYVAEARALATEVGSEKECRAALAAMRKALPQSPNFMHHNSLAREPAVRRLRERRSATLREVTRTELASVAGKLPKLSDPDAVYAYALTLVLEACAKDEDWPVLFRLWTDSKSFELLDYGRLMRRREGKAYMASLFGRDSTTHYANQEQNLAGQALLELDPKRALAIVTKLVAKKKRSQPHEWALAQMFERFESKPRKEWIPVLTKASAETGEVGVEALATLARWRQKGAAVRVVERLAANLLDVERACSLLEAAKDKSAIAPLERWVVKLAKNEKREANRARQCLSALARARSS